jgi:two-component sensor histidine kinase
MAVTRKNAAAGRRGVHTRSSRSTSAERDALLKQQTGLAKFGELALRTDDLDTILQEACRIVSTALGTDLSKIMTLEDDGRRLFVRAGVGWPDGIVGQLTFGLDEDSSDRYALESGVPVIAANMTEEKRFKIVGFVLDQGVEAFVNVPIIGTDSRPPFGILEVDSRSARQFTDDNIAFLKTYANMIASTVERHRILAEVRELADQRRQLLYELQHRLKNNLQSMSSLIGMELHQASLKPVKSVLRSLLARIDTLRLVHEKIYASGKFDRVELASYVGELGTTLLRFLSRDNLKVGFISDLRPVTVSPDTAVPLGLIVTEFITNSVKHAFHDEGVITIRLGPKAPGEAQLVLSDDGRGFGNAATTGTGLGLIAGLSRQVGGEPRWESEKGTTLTLVFPVENKMLPLPDEHRP